MTSITSFLQRYPVATFCTLTILLTFATYLLPLPREALPFVMVLLPAIVAISLTAISEGSSGVRSLLSKLTQWRVSLKWVVIALATALAMRLTISVVALLLRLIPVVQLRPLTLGEVALLAVIFIVAAIPEELGWRGYALARLLQNRSAVFASLILGVLWGLVHLALHLPGMPNDGLPGALTVFQLIGLSVLLTWFFIRGGKSIVLTSLFHAAQSFFVIVNDGITLSQQVWLMAVVWIATAVIVVMTNRSMQGSESLKQG